jgi:type IV secretion system protein TrbL
VAVCDVPVISTVCDVAGDAAATLVSAPFDWLAQAIGHAAAWMFEGVWAIFDSTTLVDVTSSGYVSVYNLVFGIGIVLTLLLFCLQLLTGLIRRDPSALPRAALGLARSVLGSFLVIAITAVLLEIVDQLCIGIVQATGTTMEEMGGRIAALAAGLVAVNVAAPGAGAIITIFLAGLAISAAAIVWFSLLIRKALLLVAVVMAPIALSGQGWDASRGWFGKWAAFVLALIVSKFVIVIVFLVAITQVSAPIDFDLASISQPIAGIVLMFVAGFAPYMCYKLISFIGVDTYHAMSTEQEAKNALNRPVPIPAAPRTDNATKVLDAGNTSASTRGGDTPSSPGGGPAPTSDGPTPTGSTSGGSKNAPAPAAAPSGTAGGASAGGAAAGPAGIAAAAGGKLVKDTATAGPKLGKAAGAAAEQHADASQQNTPTTPPPPATPHSAEPSIPAPPAPPDTEPAPPRPVTREPTSTGDDS